jgi:exopolyphosphatase/guanosine-5'-triphosphate,3'-diphosphate pyrophosphatase
VQKNTKNFGVIDIGSVAIRAEVLSVNLSNIKSFSIAYAEREMPKLGLFEENNIISQKSLNDAQKYLLSFAKALRYWNCEKIIAVGTAVFRQASNSNEALIKLEKALELPIKVIDEVEEAILISEGISHFETTLPQNFLLLDIGGRSSEISLVENQLRKNSISLPFGAISIQSEFFKSYIPTTEEETHSRVSLKEKIFNKTNEFKSDVNIVVGSSGTLRMAKRMIEDLENKKIDTISRSQFSDLYKLLLDETNPLTQKLLLTEKNRKELVYSGLIILDEVIQRFNIDQILISKFSLRHGLLKRMIFEGMAL